MTEPWRAFEADLKRNFQFSPTRDQAEAMSELARFCLSTRSREVFLLKGYAGTGKTTLIRSLVKTLWKHRRKPVLLAPTGRAAKVMSQYAKKPAFTIHKYIYVPRRGSSGFGSFKRRENKASNSFYIVDEASMIGDERGEEGRSLLDDLLTFVNEGVNCKVIMVGDVAQLPPVHTEISPALDPQQLELNHRLSVFEKEMRQVMRQAEGSVLLSNATRLREAQQNEEMKLPRLTTGADVRRLLEGFEIEEALNDSFREVGREGTALIVRSNKRAGLYNRQIRQRILWQEDEISAGDFLMVVKNNYFWLPKESKANFIANGDIAELLRIYEIKELYGYRFARVRLRLVDYPDEDPFEAQIFLDVLDLPSASLPWEEGRQFYQSVLADYQELPSKYKQHQAVRENPYFNALQVKFAYAVTCHKAQGGQWQNVFVEKPWLPDGEVNLDYLRWLYTAFTRAREKIYLIGFGDEYFTPGPGSLSDAQ